MLMGGALADYSTHHRGKGQFHDGDASNLFLACSMRSSCLSQCPDPLNICSKGYYRPMRSHNFGNSIDVVSHLNLGKSLRTCRVF